jgi:uncharacterized protein YbbC (DUF1343 family)
VLLVDLQDLGCRIYTFITTLRYVLEAAAQHGKAVWVLDRPNPAGRPVEGLTLREGWESFVGAGPMPMRHGMTMGELATGSSPQLRLDVEYRVITMDGWQPDEAPGFGWPTGAQLGQPQPQRRQPVDGPRLCRHGDAGRHHAVEGRGTTRPLELFGAPDIDARACWPTCAAWRRSGCWLPAARMLVRAHLPQARGQLCAGVQIHVEDPQHYDHAAFKPWRLQALAFKAVRLQQPDYPLWRDFPYEYEHDRLAIDLINGGPLLREWVDELLTVGPNTLTPNAG